MMIMDKQGRRGSVSIIVPSFNKERYIAATIASVVGQSWPHWELVIVDDASTDGTMTIVEEWAAREPRIRIHRFPHNVGANRCRNMGVELATSKYLVFLDADDILSADCLEKRVEVIHKSGYDLCIFTMEVFHRELGDSKNRWIPDSKDPLADFFTHDLPWSIMQPIWRTDRMRELGGFDEAFSRHQDVDLHTRALLHTGMAFKQVVGRPDCFYRIAEERKNYDPFGLVDRWTDSAVRYYFKFLPAAAELGKAPLLLGIVYKTYLQILYHRKVRRISTEQFQALEQKLFDPRITEGISAWKRFLFDFSRTYNLLPVRIPGVNRSIGFLLVR